MQSEWLQFMSQVRDRARGAPLILLLSGALLLIMGGWPALCTAMPKDLLLDLSDTHNGSGTGVPRCDPKASPGSSGSVLDSVSLSGYSAEIGNREGGTTRTSVSSSETGVVRILSRFDRAVSSINSGAVRRRHRMQSGSPTSALQNSRARENSSSNRTKSGSNLERNERSANLSHITSKIQLFIKNRLLQILPDGTVNGTQDDSSDYTILQRTAVDIGKIRIQSVATCLFLCMDACGSAFASKEFSDECVFNEAMELHHYNTYSSTKHSNSRRILYLALNRHGQTRKIHIPITRSLGKLSTYTNALTHPVDEATSQSLLAKLFGANHVRHGLKQLCDSPKVHLKALTSPTMIPRPKCSLGKKIPQVPASLLSEPAGAAKKGKKKAPTSKKCRGDDDSPGVDAGNCSTPMQLLVQRKRGPRQGPVKCEVGDDNCILKKSNKRRTMNAAAGVKPSPPGKTNSNSNHNSRQRKKMMLRTTTIPTTTTAAEEEEDMELVDEDGAGGSVGVGSLSMSSERLDDLADSSTIPSSHHAQFHFNRLSPSLVDDDEHDFD